MRLDLDNEKAGWAVYNLHEKFTKIPRHLMDLEARKVFDLAHIDYQEGKVIEDEAAAQTDENA